MTRCAYETLGLPRSATASEIKSQYRKLALKLHPDKGGDPEEFKALNEAFQVLSDEKTRNLYDQYGWDILQDAGTAGAPPRGDFMEMMFGQREHVPRIRPIVHKISLPLEKVVHGCMEKIRMERRVVEPSAAERKACVRCHGQGFVSRMDSMHGMMMFQTEQRPCDACSATGITNLSYTTEKMDIEIQIEPGVEKGHRTILEKRGHQAMFLSSTGPQLLEGDVILEIDYAAHSRFQVVPPFDLFCELTISLKEAVVGLQRKLDWLGQVIDVHIRGEDILQPEEIWVLRGKGIHKNGDLYCQLHVRLPETWEDFQREVGNIAYRPKAPSLWFRATEDPRHRKPESKSREDHEEPRAVQCATQ